MLCPLGMHLHTCLSPIQQYSQIKHIKVMVLNYLHLKKTKKPMEWRNTTVWVWHANIAYIPFKCFKNSRSKPQSVAFQHLSCSSKDVFETIQLSPSNRSDLRESGVWENIPKMFSRKFWTFNESPVGWTKNIQTLDKLLVMTPTSPSYKVVIR